MKNVFTINEFAGLTFLEKNSVLTYKGVLLDKYPENGTIISVYRLFNFFIEVSRDKDTNATLDIMPFMRGFAFGVREPERTVKKKNLPILRQAA